MPSTRMPLQRRREENGTSCSSARGSDGNRSPIARSVVFRTPALAAKTARAYARASSSPSAGTISVTRSRASVSVPVLSRQRTSTDARDSSAFSCCVSAPRRAMRTAESAKVRLTSRISPSGTRVTTAATAVVTASRTGAWRSQSA